MKRIPRPKFIYRIQNEEGLGPFMFQSSGIASTNEKWVIPLDDVKLRPQWSKLSPWEQSHYYFGFKSMHQLSTWFTKTMINKMKKNGFNIVKIPTGELYDVITGSNQVAFRSTSYPKRPL